MGLNCLLPWLAVDSQIRHLRIARMGVGVSERSGFRGFLEEREECCLLSQAVVADARGFDFGFLSERFGHGISVGGGLVRSSSVKAIALRGPLIEQE